MIILYSFIILLAIALGLTGLQILKIREGVRKLSYHNKPFLLPNPQATLKFLFVGDSTALGTGAVDNKHSVAGWFGADFPLSDIKNVSANGKRLIDLVHDFPPYPGEHYDLVVVQIGANDIFKFSRFEDIEEQMTTVIQRAKTIASHVVILHSGNAGLAPIFIWPFDWIMTDRARHMRALYMRKAKEEGVLYVDLFTERGNDLFLKDIDKYYSADHLHPSGWGYRWWYERIRQTLDQAGVRL
ncbi:MAG: SGNH/GDSL hydrolase family protein [Candidatus Omnitrophica bacterium]|nr:SGNH/GDSL hydrolase family protein [Candidatus Omnitrophota bacterium]